MSTLVAGADLCNKQWLCASHDLDTGEWNAFVVPTIAELVEALPGLKMLCIDIPIGLLEAAQPGGRECDKAARKILGGKRASSVFPPPIRPVLEAADYKEACAISRASSSHGLALSKQCYMIAPKIRELDEYMTPARQLWIREIHPELAWLRANDGLLIESKHSVEGRIGREQLLGRLGLPTATEIKDRHPRARAAALDDVFDGIIGAWVAREIVQDTAKRVPEGDPPRDERGLRMEMWY